MHIIFDFSVIETLSDETLSKVALIRRINDYYTKTERGALTSSQFDLYYELSLNELFWIVDGLERYSV